MFNGSTLSRLPIFNSLCEQFISKIRAAPRQYKRFSSYSQMSCIWLLPSWNLIELALSCSHRLRDSKNMYKTTCQKRPLCRNSSAPPPQIESTNSERVNFFAPIWVNWRVVILPQTLWVLQAFTDTIQMSDKQYNIFLTHKTTYLIIS